MNDDHKPDPERDERLRRAGWRTGTVDEFLGLTEEESALVEERVREIVKQRLRERRASRGKHDA